MYQRRSICKFLFFLYWGQTAVSMSLMNVNPLFSLPSDTAQDVTDFVMTNGYYPNDKDLPKGSVIKKGDNDATYLLSKLSDETLIKLLTEQPKTLYNMNDILKLAVDTNGPLNPATTINQKTKNKQFNRSENLHDNLKKKNLQTASDNSQAAFFRLDNKEVDPFAKEKETQSSAVQKINNLFYNHPTQSENKDDYNDEQKELLFDVLVGQLKALCCKRNRPSSSNSKHALKSFITSVMSKTKSYQAPEARTSDNKMPSENLFLILNDEIKTKGNDDDDLILVDPDSLGKNSSVLLLGPIATPLSDAQLKVVMMRISNELSKLEYLPLLQQISEGTLSGENKGLINSLISGQQTRRYIKPHRCNHQSKLARVYGGPKWLICTGYLNLNGPSLYD